MKMVTKVIDYKLFNGRRYYKVKWECTWELEDNLLYCHELVDQFWGFVNRVKSEDNRIHVRKKVRIDDDMMMKDEDESIICINIKNKNDDKTKINSYSEDIAPCFQAVHQENESKPDELQNCERDKKLESLHSNDDNDDSCDEIGKTVSINTPIVVTPIVIGKGRNIVDDTVSNPPSMVIINPLLTLQQASKDDDDSEAACFSHHRISVFDKRNYRIQDSNSEEHFSQSPEVVKMQRQEIVKPSDSFAQDITFEQDPNDVALHWKNPYVRISFICRICNEEQPFSNNDEDWKKHFLTHVQGAHQEEESEISLEEATLDDVAIIQDPEKPWIQKVEYIIQKWGVNQYVRLAFLCRSCGKEQQPLHTGNWRNHYNSHRDNRPHPCQKCCKTFKSKYYLKQHLKIVHDEVERKAVFRSCFVCAKVFTRRLDMKRHIADVHNIDPKMQTSPDDCENQSLPIISHFKTNQVHDIQKETINDKTDQNNVSILTKDSDLPSPLSHSKIIHSEDVLQCGKCFQTYPSKGELSRHRRSCHSLSENSYEKKIFKHTCGICQKGFKKKIDLKCHTVDVHCIDISNSTSNTDVCRNEPTDPLTPSMVDLVQNTLVKNCISLNEFPNNLVDKEVEDRTSIEPTKLHINKTEELLILVKEELISSEDEEKCSNELTIDEKPPSDD